MRGGDRNIWSPKDGDGMRGDLTQRGRAKGQGRAAASYAQQPPANHGDGSENQRCNRENSKPVPGTKHSVLGRNVCNPRTGKRAGRTAQQKPTSSPATEESTDARRTAGEQGRKQHSPERENQNGTDVRKHHDGNRPTIRRRASSRPATASRCYASESLSMISLIRLPLSTTAITPSGVRPCSIAARMQSN
jgi:hypothetical protein